jgi:hypothetical protein
MMKRMIAARFTAALALGLATSASAASPPGRYVLTPDTVRDTQTSLTWQRVPPAAAYDKANAAAYCQSLTLGGLSGWRLPTIKELQSLIDVRAHNGAIDTSAFPVGAARDGSDAFWSSTLQGSFDAFVVRFSLGETRFFSVQGSLSVRCVR